MIEFREINEENFRAVIDMKRPADEHFVAPNAVSLAQAWLYRDTGTVHPFAVYDGETPVGFMMLDEDLETRELNFWRILFPVEHENRGYGTAAMQKVIALARASGKYTGLTLGCVPENKRALHVYEKLGFRPTGEIYSGEIVMRLSL